MSDARSADLRALLSAHTPNEPDEREHLRRMLELLDSERPLSRAQYAPGHFTASAFVLAPDGGALLLIHHARLDRWLQPGGHVEADDAGLLAAARREVREEVGLDDVVLEQPRVFDVDIHPIPAGRGEPAHEHFDVRFVFRARTRAVQLSDEAHAARWVRFDELDPQSADRSVLRAVEKLRAAAEPTLAARR